MSTINPNRPALASGLHAPARPANFGALRSAIARGDLDQAKTALSTLSEAGNPAAKRLAGSPALDAIRTALDAGDIAAARDALGPLRNEPRPAAADASPSRPRFASDAAANGRIDIRA